jgi:hypothetical protein
MEEQGQASYRGRQPVTRIFLGSRISAQNEEQVVKVCRRLNVPVTKMAINAYALEFKPVPKLTASAA